AACPRVVLRGNLFRQADFARLRGHYESRLRSNSASPEPCSPGAGLYGHVSYHGDFAFGEYDKVLVFDHLLHSWTMFGDLSSLRRPFPVPVSSAGSDPKFRFRGNLDRASFCELVARAQDYIAAGD